MPVELRLPHQNHDREPVRGHIINCANLAILLSISDKSYGYLTFIVHKLCNFDHLDIKIGTHEI